jgi:hypothetical protein
MKNVSWAVAWVASIVVGCGGVAFTPPPGDDSGVGDSGGGGDSGGDFEAGPDAPPDAPATCPTGSIQFTLQVAPGSATSYCNATGCQGLEWLTILTEGGKALTLGSACTTDCHACMPIACPLLCAAPSRIPPAGETFTWTGNKYDPSTCGAGISCVTPDCAQAGTYVAHMCGYAEKAPEASVGACVGDTNPTCVDVRFDWPPAGGSGTVNGVLGAPPPVDAGACCPSGWDMHDCKWPDGGAGLACHDPAKGCASSTVCGQGCDSVVMGRCADGG